MELVSPAIIHKCNETWNFMNSTYKIMFDPYKKVFIIFYENKIKVYNKKLTKLKKTIDFYINM